MSNNNRRHLTPSPAGAPTLRRGGARREVSTRVFFRDPEGKTLHEGWALNVSRGGVRAILEEKVELGQEFLVEVGSEDGITRKGRIVWLQEEPDGVIVGVEFTGLSGAMEAAPGPDAKTGQVRVVRGPDGQIRVVEEPLGQKAPDDKGKPTPTDEE